MNKRETAVALRVRVADIPIPAAARARLRRSAGRLCTSAGVLTIRCDEHRSQARNRAACIARLSDLVQRALIAPKRRKPTRPTRASVRRRLDRKGHRSETKRRRRPPPEDSA